MKKARQKLFMLLLAVISFTGYLQAQVTIGDGTAPQNYSILEVVSKGKGGMRLPQLTTAQRDALKDAVSGQSFSKDPSRVTPYLYEGLTIYNTTTRCVEYYNAQRWISMCDGTSQMAISPTPCNNVAADGTGCDQEFTVSDPECPNGPFTFTVVIGAEFATLNSINEADGSFKISFQSNNSINQRSAIIRVTSSCTGLYKDFLFTQLGQTCDPTLGEAPAITSIPSGKNIKFCTGGSVYLSIPAGTPHLDEVIWTRNNIEIARGVNNISVTQAGVYDVWMGLIGCGQKAGNAVTVTKDGTGAPDKVGIVVMGNNGLVCGTGGTTKLVAAKPSAGTVRWFKDGVLQAATTPDNEVNAGVGEWFAVVNDGTCWSKPSDVVTVAVDPNSGAALTTPVIVKPTTFCAGSSVQLSVNDATHNSTYTYTWYENNTQLGVGRYLIYNVPTGSTSVVIRCRATLSGSCAAEALSTETISAGTIPDRPVITGNPVLCSGSATLNVVATSTGTFTYAWYKDGQLIGTSQSMTVTTGGDYYATVIEAGGCASPQAHINVSNTSSAVPTVTLNRSAENPNQNDVVTYSASINFGPATGYTWTITNATLQSGGQSDTPFAVVKFDQTGAASVKLAVSNACGTGEATHAVGNVSPACADPATVSPTANSSYNTVAGQGITLGPVSATFVSGTPATKYQWYKNTTNTNTGGTAISGANGNTYVANENTSGTYYYYCEVSNAGCTSTALASGVYTVIASPNPANLAPGEGSFIGMKTFDIAFSNDNAAGCGSLTGRASFRTDFSLSYVQDTEAGTCKPTFTGTQVYTFKPTAATVSNVRFVVIDPSGKVIDTYTPNADYSANIGIGTGCKLTVKYKPSLNNDAKGLTRDLALKADIYAVYNDKINNSGTDKAVKLTVSVQDCGGCGAYVASGVWKEFMCHNLGADEKLDPFTPVAGIHGAKYKFGAKNPSLTQAQDQASAAAIPNWTNISIYPYQNDSQDWKPENNPCPTGWRVPTKTEWNGLINQNLNPQTYIGSWYQSSTNFSAAVKLGTRLFIPITGSRTTTGVSYWQGYIGVYWSSHYETHPHAMRLQGGTGVSGWYDALNWHAAAEGAAVRCIAE